MSFNTALTAGNLTSLRSTTWYGDQYLTLCENTEVFAARVNGAISGGPFASITYDTVTTGAYTDIELGQVILVSATNDKRAAYFRGRIRATPTSSIVYINETSIDIADNDYIWVINTYDLTDRLARPVSNVQYKDYNLSYQGLLPVVKGLRTAYVGWVGSNGKYRIALDASASFAAESGATISSYQYTFRAASYTVISGSLSTAIVTIDLDPGVGQWGKLVVTDSGGRAQTFRFYCKAHNDSYPPSLGFDGATVNGALNEGFSASVSAFTDVDSVLNRTFAVVWTKEYYGGTETSIVNNIDMVGWFLRESDTGKPDQQYSYISDATFDIAGAGTLLSRIESQLLAIRAVNAADEWDEIVSLTPWRAVVHYLQRHTTLLNLCSLDFDVTDTSYAFPYLSTQGGNVLATINGILEQINAALEFAPDGRMQAYRSAEFLSSSARSALVTVAPWDDQDYVDPGGVDISFEHLMRVGKVDADGAFYNSASGTVTALRSRAPGYAQGEAEASTSISNQILSSTTDQNNAQTELNQRSGDKWEIENNTVTLKAQHTGGYHFLIPSQVQWYTWTLTTSDNNRGLSYTTSTRWLLQNISHTHSNERGSRTVSTTYKKESNIGAPGDTVPIIPDGTVLPTLPEFPPFDAFPAFPDLLWPEAGWLPSEVPPGVTLGPDKGLAYTKDGNTVIIWTASQAWITHNFIKLKAPLWYEITPVPLGGSYAIKQVQTSPIYTDTALPCAVLASDGTNSKVFYTANVCDKPPVWTEGTAYPGAYNAMRFSSTAGSLLIYNPGGANVSQVDTFTINPNNSAYQNGTYTTNITKYYKFVVTGEWYYATPPNPTSYRTDAAAFTTTDSWSTHSGGGGCLIQLSSGSFLPNSADAYSSSHSYSFLPVLGTGAVFSIRVNDGGWTDNESKNIQVDVYEITNADVRLSTDYGSTFGSTIAVGSSAGAQAGFDLNYIGAASLVASDQQVKKATTLGGAYSNEANGAVTGGQPTLLLIPWYQFGSTTTKQFNNSSPQYLLGSNTEVSSNALWRVTGSGQTDISPAASVVAVGPFSAMMWKGTKIGILMDASGTRTLYTTSNAGGSPPTWTSRSTAVSGALYCRGRRKSGTGNQIYICGGATLKYSGTFGAALYSRTPPTSDSLLGIEVIG